MYLVHESIQAILPANLKLFFETKYGIIIDIIEDSMLEISRIYLESLVAPLYISYYFITETRNLIRLMRISHQWLHNILCNKCLLVCKLEFVRV